MPWANLRHEVLHEFAEVADARLCLVDEIIEERRQRDLQRKRATSETYRQMMARLGPVGRAEYLRKKALGSRRWRAKLWPQPAVRLLLVRSFEEDRQLARERARHQARRARQKAENGEAYARHLAGGRRRWHRRVAVARARVSSPYPRTG
jgi:hypothetical protein